MNYSSMASNLFRLYIKPGFQLIKTFNKQTGGGNNYCIDISNIAGLKDQGTRKNEQKEKKKTCGEYTQ